MKAADDDRVFLIDQALAFNFGSLDGDSTFAWKDMSGDDGDMWEFVSSKTVPRPTISLFEVTLLHCIYERVRGMLEGLLGLISNSRIKNPMMKHPKRTFRS